MQSKFLAIKALVDLVIDGMKLVGTPMERFDDIMESVIKTLSRHRQESGYAETELFHIGYSVRHIELWSMDGAIIFPTRHDGKIHLNDELVGDIENTLYFSKGIIEQMKGMI